jgi:hypothetical protein
MPMTINNTSIFFNDGTSQDTSAPKVRVAFDGRFQSSGGPDPYGFIAGPISTIFNSFNITSITKNNLGDYTLNFASAFANVNYCMVGTSNARSGHAYRGLSLANGQTPATTSIRITTGTTGGSSLVGIQEDCERIQIAIFA